MSQSSIAARPSPEVLQGFVCTLLAYVMWGLQPLYMKLMTHIPVFEIIAHRIIWSVPVAGLLLLLTDRSGAMRQALANPRIVGMACMTASLIAANWTIYIWAITENRALDAALGYYINPLMNVLIGVVFLKERLSRPQVLAMALATAAVLLLTVKAGGLPWVSLVLALSFAVYGYCRKTMPVGALQGFMLEVLLLSVPALGYLMWSTGGGVPFGDGSGFDIFLLLLAGPITAAPLIMFSAGARRLRLSTIGIMQYVGPTLIFIVAVFGFREPFSTVQAVAFGLIWVGLIIFGWASIAAARR
ncbi:chloramphenicol-sensitive protein RarD [Pseudochelatococcus lubricantis]|uniref:Chloramphenicol-sensitive protein RarD n=1 Tax=Pseudochelatococcus lubricantis TaxID=1538102 RepID=A0ABX0V1Y9_9HYPH|nr:EamA family transporter RarD [Pseudochelatococcus lubricantis]NIJ58230.1 chloramphenicol-sensitive protein RarD [Pseudochelatococcus lubricantis]